MSAPREDAAGGDALRLVGFRIGDWRFCIRLAQVQTSLMPCEITRVFHTPGFVRGIISLRGIIVCVLDLGRLLGLAEHADSHNRFLVVSEGGVQAAIPVGDVFRIPEIPGGLVEPLPASVAPAHRTILEGVINTAGLDGSDGRTGQDTLTLIDAGTLFDAPEVAALRSRR